MLLMFRKRFISFNFSFFFIIYTTYHNTPLTTKNFYTHLPQKKITQLDGFFVDQIYFSQFRLFSLNIRILISCLKQSIWRSHRGFFILRFGVPNRPRVPIALNMLQ